VQCPGQITVRAATKSFVGPASLNQDMPEFPRGTLVVPMMLTFDNAPAGVKSGWAGMPYKLFADGALVKQDVLDDAGAVLVMHSPTVQGYRIEMANGVRYEVPVVDSYRNAKQGALANKGFLKHEPGSASPDTGETRTGESLREFYQQAFKA
jgi:type VI secretion system secreted protein VgrG